MSRFCFRLPGTGRFTRIAAVKLTIVTATRNVIAAGNRDALSRCIDSVTKLNTPHEHLIYDGASTDGTSEMLHELASKIPTLKVVSEPDTGIYNALNKGVRDANGEWYYVLGCDDWIFAPSVLDGMILNAGHIRLLVAPVRAGGSVRQIPDRSNLSSLFFRTPHCHQGVLVRTDDIRMIGGFDERFKICADFDAMLKLHDRAISVRYSFEPFADYSLSGLSEREYEIRMAETAGCVRHFLNLPEGPGFRDRSSPPFHTMARFIFHKDVALRLSARFMIRKRTKQCLRIILYPLVLLTRPIRTAGPRRCHGWRRYDP